MNLNLKITRMKQCKTQYDLSYMTRIPQGVVSLIETGVKQPTPEQALKIAGALQVRIDEIFPELKGTASRKAEVNDDYKKI